MDEKDQTMARELTDFAFAQFEWYRKHNPAIARVFDAVVADERFQDELANVFYPIFYALKRLRDGGLPLISDETAQRAQEEWCSPEAAELIEKEFDYWVRATPEVTNFFFLFLGILVKPRERSKIYEGTKKIFTLILRMIRLEDQRQPS